MQKYKAHFLKAMGLAILLLSLTFYSSDKSSAASNPVNISTSPDSVLFDITNMKPGDWAERTLTIQNRGRDHFNYSTKAEFKGGSEKLYNEFLLEVMDASGQLYEGKLSHFTQLEPRYLQSHHQEDLKFTIRFPSELGNEFQGLYFEVVFKFVAEGKQSNPPEPPKQPDPPKDPPDQPEQPEDPEEPKEPEQPEEPEQPDPPGDKDPDDPGQPSDQDEDENDKEQPEKPVEEEEDEAVLLPQRPIVGKDLIEKVKEGQILPSTATNTYNYLMIGLLMILIGGTIYVYNNRRTLHY